MRYSKDSGYGGNKKKLLGNYFFTIGISYYCILSFASVYYNYDWGALYRVSGFGLLFMLNAFWIYTFTYVNWRKYILVILIISSITKVTYGLRYEILSNQHRFLFQDYRESIKAIIDYTNKEYEDIYVYIDKSGLGRNLYYMLLYYDLIYSLPFEVNKFSNNIIKSTSVIFCTEIDLNQFRDFIHVDDVADAVIALCKSNYSGNINIGSGKCYSIKKICSIIEKVAKVKIRNLNKKVDGPMKYYHDIGLVKKVTGWKPKINLEEGLEQSWKQILNWQKIY